MEEELSKRAKLRALRLLEMKDRTEAELRQKLKEDGYPEEMIDVALQYVKKFGYVEDNRYAENFIQSRRNSKSKREIQVALYQKGLDREVVQSALENCYDGEDETATIRRILEKKRYHQEEATDRDRKKMYAYLSRKGFRYEDIQQVLQVSSWNA